MKGLIELPSSLDVVAAPKLLREILEKKGSDIEIDASKVQRLGGQCLQILLAAEAAWADGHHMFKIKNPSPEFVEYLNNMGLILNDLEIIEQKG